VGEGLRVLFVGSRILPTHHPGDKTYWLNLFDRLASKGLEVRVLSVTYEPVSTPASYAVEYVRPIPVQIPSSTRRYSRENRWLEGTNNYLSKTLSFGRVLRGIARARDAFRPDVVHFIDNYGPVMLLVPAIDRATPKTIAAPTYFPRWRLYDEFLRASFAPFNAIAPFSDAFSRRLRDMGITGRPVVTIRWGVDPERVQPPTEAERRASRLRLGIAPDRTVVMWTGFIQQTDWRDFRFAHRLGELTMAAAPDRFAFLYCFKPAHFRPELRELERAGMRILGSAPEYEDARTATDCLLSPISATRSTAAPPLTWVESLARGIPILSTWVPGAEEAIVPGESGWFVRSPEEGQRLLIEEGGDPARLERLRAGARRTAVERFSLDRAADQYVELWKQLSGGARPGR
jgi:glycosyltransferase involved in cell wall biosynthesis